MNRSYPCRFNLVFSILYLECLGFISIIAMIIGCECVIRASNSVRLFMNESAFVYKHVNFVLNGACDLYALCSMYNVVFIILLGICKLLPSKGNFLHDSSIYDNQMFFFFILPSFHLLV